MPNLQSNNALVSLGLCLLACAMVNGQEVAPPAIVTEAMVQ